MNGRRAGFTLIETLAALVIGSGAILLGYGAFALATDLRSDVGASAQATLRAAVLRDNLLTLLAGAHIGDDPDASGFVLHDVNGDGMGDRLTFTSEAGVSPRGQLTLAWTADALTQRLILIHHATGGAEDTVQLSSWIGMFRMRVLTEHGWSGNWSSGVVLPRAIEVALATTNADSLARSVETPLLVQWHTSQ